MSRDRMVYFVHHYNGTKDLRHYSETSGEWITHTDRPIAAFDTREQAEAHVTAEIEKITRRDGWNVRDMKAGGRGYGSRAKIGTEVVRRGERHEFRVYSVPYTPAPVAVLPAVLLEAEAEPLAEPATTG